MFDHLPDIQAWPSLGTVRSQQRLGFSKPKAPASNPAMEAKQMELMQAQLEQAKKGFQMPNVALPPPAPPPPPPPTSSSADAVDAAKDSRRQAQNRTGVASTILAGETGGYRSNSLGGKTSILG